MTANSLVSIIVPVYNSERYLRHCVDSVLAQSHRTLEVILVDDGATDSSPAICDEYAAADPRVTVIHQPNGGIAKAQNTGLDAASGDYIAFVDNDDILDRRNIELLLHALESTGADMSKARWRQFGVSQLETVAREAAIGADEPKRITVFRNPLLAYQTVFCKTLRMLGDVFGRNTEARYFNEANWCRLYRRKLWDGLRFPEGMYAQDVMVSGELYSRMNKVADIDVNLYNWLQSAGSVTHKEAGAAFFHDNVQAGIANFRYALDRGITPARSYYIMIEQHHEAAHAPDAMQPDNQRICHTDMQTIRGLISTLAPWQRCICFSLYRIRLIEKHIYDRRIKNII
ncbi:glycosyltransferase family 2 protein [Bifidobacterium simiiventris]|uniref:glycosyltransferase family 2 protein n=1 Tax=Bifidobacterium simiiventris TaxID=2834434 RepID=UPI001C59E366|nr:glycosyltransferase family 2 protein [Bifidobacterium simiiventris]MBW3079647.1 glycosyltransferase family 2 protein [Bifidobacterium simiiventris]